MTAYLNALGVICALGRDKRQVAQHLFAGDCSGMRLEGGWVPERELPVAAVQGDLAPIPQQLTEQRSRNNQLLLEAALQIRDDIEQAIQTYGRERIGVVLGTSTSGIDEASRGLAHYISNQQFPVDYDYRQQELGARRIFSPTGCNSAARPT
jgi:3-oxoacyl-[acyl-carrier-protein] synthase-1